MYEERDLTGHASSSINASVFSHWPWLLSGEYQWIFINLYQHFSVKFPRHFIFANFQCIRCGRCCNWDGRHAHREDIARWIEQERYDILSYVLCLEHTKDKLVTCADHLLRSDKQSVCKNCRGGDIVPVNVGKCPFIVRARNEPYYECRIQNAKPMECSEYLCDKSLPVSHLDWKVVKDLIQKIGIKHYRSLVKAE